MQYFRSLGPIAAWHRRDEFGAMVAAPAPAFGIWAAFAAPLALGPMGLVLSLGGYRLGARRAGLMGIAIAAVGMAIGLLR